MRERRAKARATAHQKRRSDGVVGRGWQKGGSLRGRSVLFSRATMILNRTLTAEERRISQRCIEAFNFGNGMSYMCLGESILVLFAARLGAPNAVVALLGVAARNLKREFQRAVGKKLGDCAANGLAPLRDSRVANKVTAAIEIFFFKFEK